VQNLIFVMGFHAKVDNVWWALIANFGYVGWVTVPDRRCWIQLEVVLVSWVIGVLGIWRGRVWGKGWDRGGQFTSNLRPRWTDPVTARRVPSKEKGGRKGNKGESTRGDKKQGECAIYIVICVRVYKEWLKRLNDNSCIYA
jgi:hypothetical protein